MAKDELNISPSTSEGTGKYESTEPEVTAGQPNPPRPTSVPGEQPLGSPGGILGQGRKDPTPTMQQDVNTYMKSYINELTSLGPEYAKEMQFLAPYMTGNPGFGLEQAVAKEYGGSGVQTPKVNVENEALGAASQAGAQQIESFTPGFGKVAAGAKESEQTVPYSDVLNSVLTAQKNELLYGSTPNFSAINTSQWGPSMQALYGYLQQAAGGGSVLGINPATAASTLAPATNSPSSVASLGTSSSTGGGNIQ